MDFVLVFNSTIVVLWAVMAVPNALKNRDIGIYLSTGTPLLVIECWLMWDRWDFPFNILASIAVVAFATGGGYVQHYFNQKQEQKDGML